MKKPADSGGLSRGLESQAGALILTLPTREFHRRTDWRRLVEATRDPRTWDLIYQHRHLIEPRLGRVVRR